MIQHFGAPVVMDSRFTDWRQRPACQVCSILPRELGDRIYVAETLVCRTPSESQVWSSELSLTQFTCTSCLLCGSLEDLETNCEQKLSGTEPFEQAPLPMVSVCPFLFLLMQQGTASGFYHTVLTFL